MTWVSEKIILHLMTSEYRKIEERKRSERHSALSRMNIFAGVFLIILTITGCSGGPAHEYVEINGLTQGSTYHIVFEAAANRNIPEVRRQIEDILSRVDHSLSIYSDSSVISLINSNKSDQADPLLLDVVQQSAVVWKESGGAFDITVGPLVKAWGFGPDAMKRFDESKLDSLLALVGMKKIRIEGNRLIKADPNMFIDVNAIAQGYTVDLIIDELKKLGIDNCLVEVGGEVRALGNKDGNGWRIGIDKPEDGNYIPGADLEAIIRLKNTALATSGNYRKFYVDNGIKYSHTIDPHTGYPARHTILSASILAPDCSTADAWATACMVVGVDSAKIFIRQHSFLEGYLIYSDNQGAMKTWMSDGVKKLISEQ